MSNVYAAIEIWDLCCDNMICKNDRLVYNFSLWDLAHSSMFMFYQVRVWYPTTWDFYVIYFRSFEFDRVKEQEVPKYHIIFIILIGAHV